MLDTVRGLIFGRLQREAAAERPRIADPERFRPKVGDVRDIEAAASGTAADVHRKSDLQPWQLALSLVNRDSEVDRLCERLQDLARAGAPRALLVILPCESSDCHDYFLARCVKFGLKEIGRVEPDYWALGWPEKPSMSRLIADLTKILPGPGVEDLKSLNDRLEKYGPPICVSYVLDGEHWKADQGKTLNEWAAIFAQAQLKLHKDRFLVAFLCFLLRRDKTEYCKRLEDMAKEWDDKGTKRNPAVVRIELPLVRQAHLYNWRASARERLGYDLDFQLISEINHIFKDGPVFMDVIAENLREPLQRIFTPRPEVAPTGQRP
jgi:hypothetical protein